MKQKKKIKINRKMQGIAGVSVWLVFSFLLLFSYLPDDVYVTREQQENQTMPEFVKGLPVAAVYEQATAPVMGLQQGSAALQADGIITCRLFHMIPIKQVVVHYTDRAQLIPAGTNIGIYLKNEGVLVVECASFRDQNGALVSPAAYRVHSRDVILAVDGTDVHTKEELMDAVEGSGGRQMRLHILRGGSEIDVAVTPQLAQDGAPKLGVWVRDDIAGIGTLTYVAQDHTYGALGHGVSDADTGEMVAADSGSIYETKITGIAKGSRGTPGEVSGMIRFQKSAYLGTIGENTVNGIYGVLEQVPARLDTDAALPIAYKQEIKNGAAQIICSVDGTRSAYEIEIERVDYHAQEENKGIRIRVTDEELLRLTGGVIQGMSGSPIIQDGKIVGAVTHVFVDDPTRGYGIFIENMLEH